VNRLQHDIETLKRITGLEWKEKNGKVISERTIVYYPVDKETPTLRLAMSALPGITEIDFNHHLTAGASVHFPPPAGKSCTYVGYLWLAPIVIQRRSRKIASKFNF
jgi:hypothetical protein